MAVERTMLFILSRPQPDAIVPPRILVRRGAVPVLFQPHVGETWKRLTRPAYGGPCLLRWNGVERAPSRRRCR